MPLDTANIEKVPDKTAQRMHYRTSERVTAYAKVMAWLTAIRVLTRLCFPRCRLSTSPTPGPCGVHAH